MPKESKDHIATKKHHNYRNFIKEAIIALLVIIIGVGGYFLYKNIEELNLTRIELTNTKSDLAQSEEKAQGLSNELETERYKNSLFTGQINEILGTVGALDKLSKTDKELLQKYSKVYFLNENYVPSELSEIPLQYILQEDRVQKIHTKVLPNLIRMMEEAETNGTPIKIVSAYRSFGEQSSLKNNYLITYGSGSNQFSADQGYSEHQLGTAVDFTTPNIGTGFEKFGSTKAYEWLLEDAYKYGFILSYPEGNSYYQFEPWHFRFVGKNLAKRLHNENENFYDLNQRTIDDYLISIFD